MPTIRPPPPLTHVSPSRWHRIGSRRLETHTSNDHAIGWRAADSVRTAATSIAGLIGADPDEVVFTSGGY